MTALARGNRRESFAAGFMMAALAPVFLGHAWVETSTISKPCKSAARRRGGESIVGGPGVGAPTALDSGRPRCHLEPDDGQQLHRRILPPERPRPTLRQGRRGRRRAGGPVHRRPLPRPGHRFRQAFLRAEIGPGRAQGALDEGRPDPGDHPRRPAEGIRRGAAPAPGQCPLHGLALRAPPHAQRAGPGLAIQVRRVRARSRGGGLAGPGPPGDRSRRQRAGLQAAVPGHAVDR